MCIQAGTATHTQACASHSHAHGTQICAQRHTWGDSGVCAVCAEKRSNKNSPICNLHFFCSLFFFPNLFILFSTEPPPRILIINKSVCKFCLPPVSLMALGRSWSCGPAIRTKWQGREQGLGVDSAPLSALAPTGHPAGCLSCADGAVRIPISAGEAAAAPQEAGARAQDGSSLFLDPSLGSGLFA